MKIVENKFFINLPRPNVEFALNEEDYVPKRSAALIKAQQKYYEKNKIKITHKQMLYNITYCKKTHICSCGDIVTNAAKYHHVRSKRHLRRLDNITNGRLAGSTPGEQYVDCPCGGHYIYKHRHQHYKTKKHILHEEAIKESESSSFNQQQTLREQLRRMLLEEDIEPDMSDNINSSEIKEL
tara:strand:- start:1298 stop:1843 length:546 start_codon:yes stop_codon:yes gene_type:complete